MKKVLICLLLCLALFGCSSNSAKLQDGSEVIWKSKNKSYTKNDLFLDMKASDYSSILLIDMIEKIGEKEGIDTTSFESEAKAEIQDMKDQGYESYIAYYYGSEENYIQNSIISKVYNKLFENEATNNYEDYVEQYVPYKAQIAYFDDEISANKLIEQYKTNDGSFEELASNNGYTLGANEQIYTDESDVPIEVKESVLSMNDGELSSVITSSTYQTSSDGESTVAARYYVVLLVSKDANNFKDEFIEELKNTLLDQTVVTNKYLEKYNVTMHDQVSYDYLHTNFEAVK